MATKDQIRQEMKQLLAQGLTKGAVFARLSGQGVPDKRLAYWLASLPDPAQRYAHSLAIGMLAVLVVAQALIVLLLLGVTAGMWLPAVVICLVLLGFAWGFCKPSAAAYGWFQLLALGSVSRQLKHALLSADPADFIAPVVSIAMVGFVFWLQHKLFPGLFLLWPRTHHGRYIFTSTPSPAAPVVSSGR